MCLLVGNIVKKPSPGLIAKVYVGSKGREVTKHKSDELSLHGVGKSQSVSAAEKLILLLITMKFFKETAKSRNESQYGGTYLEVTVAGSEVLEGTSSCEVVQERVIKRRSEKKFASCQNWTICLDDFEEMSS